MRPHACVQKKKKGIRIPRFALFSLFSSSSSSSTSSSPRPLSPSFHRHPLDCHLPLGASLPFSFPSVGRSCLCHNLTSEDHPSLCQETDRQTDKKTHPASQEEDTKKHTPQGSTVAVRPFSVHSQPSLPCSSSSSSSFLLFPPPCCLL